MATSNFSSVGIETTANTIGAISCKEEAELGVFPRKYQHYQGVNYIVIEPLEEDFNPASTSLSGLTVKEEPLVESTISPPPMGFLNTCVSVSEKKEPIFVHEDAIKTSLDLRFGPALYNRKGGTQHLETCQVIESTEETYDNLIHDQCEPSVPLGHELFTATPVQGPQGRPATWNGLYNLSNIDADLITRFQASSIEKVEKWLDGTSWSTNPWMSITPFNITSKLADSEKSVMLCKQDNSF